MSSDTDVRNGLDGVRRGRLRLLVAAVSVLGLVLLVGSLVLLRPEQAHLEPALWLVCGLLLVTEVRPLFTGQTDGTGLTLSTAFVFAILLRYGLPAALLLQVVATLLADLSKRRALWRAWFNAGQYTLSWTAAALVMQLAGHSAGLGRPLALTGSDLLAAACGAVTFFACNELLVCWALSYHAGLPLLTVLREDFGYQVLTTSALMALSPLVCLAMEQGPAFVPLLIPPLAAVYAVGSVARDREKRALTDALTGLPNRVLLTQRTTEALRSGQVALVLFDLDRFKEVNDTLGHHVGDRLLQVVAERLAGAVRACDTVARLGGDEFALLLPDLADEAARATVERLRQLLSQPVVLEGLLLEVVASAGVAVSPEHGTDVETLLKHADVAMYLSKESGVVELYDAARDGHSPDRLVLLGELRRAVEGGELELHYQPAVSLVDDSVVGVEALVRWRHPSRGLLLPDDFVPVAERGGLVQALTAWVLDAALQQLAAWDREGLSLAVSVNVSVQDLCGAALVPAVERGLAATGLPASRLLLEVTEGSLLADPARAAGTMRGLQDLGVAVSLDDFGTGYSSLSHLRRLAVREIKVDRSFVSRMSDQRDQAVVRSVVDLGRGLGMRVVAEGVEDAATLAELAAMGCEAAQGWFLTPALPPGALSAWLRERDRRTPVCV